MKLYFSPGACSLSPHIVLREAGLAFDLEQVDVRAKKTMSGGDFFQVNPKGQVPTLVLDDGDILTEGPAIVQYIADKAPASKLAPPAGTKERYHLQEWLNFITSELHKNFSPLFRPTTPDDYKPIARENLAGRFGYVDKRLANRAFLMGDTFTVADAYLFVMTNWAKGLQFDIAPWPAVSAFRERVLARPKVQDAMKAEGLIK
jgi:glutathione S-transferase